MRRILLLLGVGMAAALFPACSGGSPSGVYYTACVVLSTGQVQERPAMVLACRNVSRDDLRRQ